MASRRWPTKLVMSWEAVRDCVPAVVELMIGCCGPLVCFMVIHVPDVVPGGV